MTLSEIVEQLRSCGYECVAGPLEMNVAFVELEEKAILQEEEYQELQQALNTRLARAREARLEKIDTLVELIRRT